MTRPEPVYVLGHSSLELARLARQARLFAPMTRALLERAGLAAGQRVLDVGCGAGDVSLLVADVVGPTGRVVAVDRALDAVAVARRRAEAASLSHVEVHHAALDDLSIAPVDAVVGRFVLMHQADPVRLLARSAAFVRPGGRVVMIESHLDALAAGWRAWPASPAYDRLLDLIRRTIHAAGGRTDQGLRLRATFLEAGLADPELTTHTDVAGADLPSLCRYWTDSLRSMAATAARLGVADLEPNDIDALERAVLAELDVSGAVMLAPPVVGAWCVVARA
jgi:precorrin-6B methylase 2